MVALELNFNQIPSTLPSIDELLLLQTKAKATVLTADNVSTLKEFAIKFWNFVLKQNPKPDQESVAKSISLELITKISDLEKISQLEITRMALKTAAAYVENEEIEKPMEIYDHYIKKSKITDENLNFEVALLKARIEGLKGNYAVCVRIIQDFKIQNWSPRKLLKFNVNFMKIVKHCTLDQDKILILQFMLRIFDNNPDCVAYRKHCLLNLMALMIETKNVTDGNRLIENMEPLLKSDPSFYCLKVKLMILKKSDLPTIKVVFTEAMRNCFNDIESNPKNFKWLTGMIYLISKYGGYMFGLECLNEMDQCFSKVQVSNTIRQNDSVTLQLLVLNIHFLIENQNENSIENVKGALERCKDIDLASASSKTCMSMLWKAGESACTRGEYQKAIEWYQLASKLLSINVADARNKAIIMNKIANCQIHLGLYSDALESCLKSVGLDPRENPITDFLLFTIYLNMDEKSQAINFLSKISFKDRPDMMMAAAELASKNNYNDIVLQILKRSFTEGLDFKDKDCSFTILRYLIQSVYQDLVSQKNVDSSNKTDAAAEVCKYIQKACQLHSTFAQDQATQSRILELEWLVGVAWNSAVYITAEGLDQSIAYSCFLAVEDLYKFLVDPDHTFTQNLISSLLMSALIQLKLARIDNNRENIKLGLLQIEKLLQLLDDCPIDQDPSLIHHAFLFQFELFCRAAMFDDAKDLLQNLSQISAKIWASFIGVFEHVLVPYTIKVSTLKLAMTALLSSEEDIYIDQYVKWACLLLQTYLSEPNMVNETFSLIKELLAVIPNCGEGAYSKDDMLWITVSIWNQSTYFWSVKDVESGKKWSELALETCQFCEECEQIENIHESYTSLLQECT